MQKRKANSIQTFKKFVDKVKQFDYLKFLQPAQNIYAIRQFKIDQLTCQLATQIYQNIFYKFNRNLFYRAQLNWWENQLRVFVWALILYVQMKKTKIQDLAQDDWQYFSTIFPNKKLILFQYQSINILKQHGQAKKWVPQQDQIFSNLVIQKGLQCKWSQLAKLLYIQSNKKYFRTPKQCRQRWLNHLDPLKSKSQWDPKQDFILIKYVYQKQQKKWAQISKCLENKRNQHSIKNRFKSLITKQKRYHKQKLEQSQLIKLIYQRYTNYFQSLKKKQIIIKQQNNLIKHQNDIKQQQISIQMSNNYLGNKISNQNNSYIIKNSNNKFKQNYEKSMFPFNWLIKEENQNISIQLRNQSQLKNSMNSKQYLQVCSYSNLDQNKIIQRNQFYLPESNFYCSSKIKTFNELPNNYNQIFDISKKYNSFNHLPQAQYNYSLNNLNNSQQINKNQNNFFPDFDIQLDQQSLDIYQENNLIKSKSKQQKKYEINKINQRREKQQQIDEKQKQIRAQIFLVDDPFQLLKPYFFNNSIQKNINNQKVEVQE